jgi:hypothetical protein
LSVVLKPRPFSGPTASIPLPERRKYGRPTSDSVFIYIAVIKMA